MSIWETYSKQEKVGKGAHGKVYKALRKSDNTVVAIKKSVIGGMALPPEVVREVVALRTLATGKHFIAKFYEFVVDGNKLFFVMEYGDSDLHKYLSMRPQGLELEEVKHFTLQLLIASYHLQKHRIMHRDLKPSNIIIKYDNKANGKAGNGYGRTIIKLIDFGLSRTYSCPDIPYSPEIHTIPYRAPEIFFPCGLVNVTKGDETYSLREYNYKVDMWSIGCIMAVRTEIGVKQLILKFVSMAAIHNYLNFVSLFQDEQNEKFEFPVAMVSGPPPKLFPLESKLRELIPRADNYAIDLLRNILKTSERIHLLSALTHPYFAEIIREYDDVRNILMATADSNDEKRRIQQQFHAASLMR
ncbi:Cyclin-dependent kinase catalytic subunit [Phlyctochytrium planicorne]|nr:Cyclin-dependent kinase catalytic subunit [Phlyctochytrium planicorne]